MNNLISWRFCHERCTILAQCLIHNGCLISACWKNNRSILHRVKWAKQIHKTVPEKLMPCRHGIRTQRIQKHMLVTSLDKVGLGNYPYCTYLLILMGYLMVSALWHLVHFLLLRVNWYCMLMGQIFYFPHFGDV